MQSTKVPFYFHFPQYVLYLEDILGVEIVLVYYTVLSSLWQFIWQYSHCILLGKAQSTHLCDNTISVLSHVNPALSQHILSRCQQHIYFPGSSYVPFSIILLVHSIMLWDGWDYPGFHSIPLHIWYKPQQNELIMLFCCLIKGTSHTLTFGDAYLLQWTGSSNHLTNIEYTHVLHTLHTQPYTGTHKHTHYQKCLDPTRADLGGWFS